MTGSRRVTGSDLGKLDSREPGPRDFAEVPELTEDWFARAEPHEGGKPVRRGRPRIENPKQAVSLRLSQRVLGRFRQGGPGWQTRINAALEAWLDEHPGKI